MFLNIIVNFEKDHSFEANEKVVLFKSFESDVIPRTNEYIQDLGFAEELLVKKVIWDTDRNLWEIETRLVGYSKTVEEVREQAQKFGWKLFK